MARSLSGPEGEALDEGQLRAELRRLTQQLAAIDASVQAAREQLANPRKEGEREVWETNVVILQVGSATLPAADRLHQPARHCRLHYGAVWGPACCACGVGLADSIMGRTGDLHVVLVGLDVIRHHARAGEACLRWGCLGACMQDTRRMHAEEAGVIQMELEGRERLRAEAEQRAHAEDSGAVAAARMAQQIAATEARLDALKQRLYFPPVKGFK